MMATAQLGSVDVQKQRYSHELAEYTFKQYDQARQSLDKTGRGRPDQPGASSESSPSRSGQPFPIPSRVKDGLAYLIC